MTTITRTHLKPLAKRSPAQIAKLAAVQEAQIESLKATIAAYEAVLTAVAPAVWFDEVCVETGEVVRVRAFVSL